MDIQKELTIRSIKILDIGYIAAMYFIIGLIGAKMFDRIFGTFDAKKEDAKHFAQVTAELIGMIWLVGTSTYIVRNLAELVPSPFDGLYGFKHSRVKELTSASGYTLIVMGYAYHLRAKLEYYNRRLNSLNLGSIFSNIGKKTDLTAPQVIDNKQ
jgi:hypothetical protein